MTDNDWLIDFIVPYTNMDAQTGELVELKSPLAPPSRTGTPMRTPRDILAPYQWF